VINFICHRDSFSNNVLDWISLNSTKPIKVIDCHNTLEIDYIIDNPSPTILSPGPHNPEFYPKTIELCESLLMNVPLLGICLGHQVIGSVAGLKLQSAKQAQHGQKRSIDVHWKQGILKNSPHQLTMGCYNSLSLVNNDNSDVLDKNWQISASNVFGEVEVIENWQNKKAPTIGFQFHPESFLSHDNQWLQSNWQNIINHFYS
jgi:anthranilate/para-aminobenzoate synthase component II